MKKIFTFLLLFSVVYAFPQTLIVDWNFPNASADLIADGGIAENLDKEISTEGGTSAIEMKNGFEDKAAQASGWENGSDLKCWVVDFTTKGYNQLNLSSKQSSGGTDPGPKDWKVQYRIGIDGSWTDVPNSQITVANDWTTGLIDSLPLPLECNDQDLISLRWIMTTNDNSAGGIVEAIGKSKIDNIVVMGTAFNAIAENQPDFLKFYPNPASGHINFNPGMQDLEVSIYNVSGQQLINEALSSRFSGSIDISGLKPGLYLVKIQTRDYSKNITRKLIVQ